MDIGIIFGQMLVLLAMMLLGAFVYKKNWIGKEGEGNISKLVVNVPWRCRCQKKERRPRAGSNRSRRQSILPHFQGKTP